MLIEEAKKIAKELKESFGQSRAEIKTANAGKVDWAEPSEKLVKHELAGKNAPTQKMSVPEKKPHPHIVMERTAAGIKVHTSATEGGEPFKDVESAKAHARKLGGNVKVISNGTHVPH